MSRRRRLFIRASSCWRDLTGMWWAKGIIGVALLVLGFLFTQPAIVGQLANFLGL
jgi:hypothetical protein